MISIIMPVYNMERYLNRALDSIIGQSYDDFEIVIIDDGSKDNSGRICDYYAKHDSRVKVFHKKNGGLDSARNYGLKKISGDFLTFIDPDDYVADDYFSTCMKVFFENPSVDLIIFPWFDLYDDNCQFHNLEKKGKVNSDVVINSVISFSLSGGGGFTWNKVWRVNPNRPMESFDEHQWIYEDKLWTINMLMSRENVFYCDKGFYYYYHRSESLSHNDDHLAERYLNCALTYEKIADIDYMQMSTKKKAHAAYNTMLVDAVYFGYKNDSGNIIDELGSKKIDLSATKSSRLRVFVKFLLIKCYKIFLK